MSGIGRGLQALTHVARTHAAHLAGGAPPGPMMAFVEVTRRCNLRCRHCDIWQTARQDPALVAQELPAPLLLRAFADMARTGLLAVDLFGGEPLLRRDLDHLVSGAAALGLHVTITTNGWRLDASRVRQLAAAGVGQVLVSLDGSHAALHDGLRGRRGAFERAVDGLRALRRHAPGIHCGIDTVITAENVDDLPALVELAGELDLHAHRFLPYHACYPFDRFADGAADRLAPGAAERATLRERLPTLRTRLAELGLATNAGAFFDGIVPYFEGRTTPLACGAGRLVCDINAAGDVFACYTLAQPAGNLRDAPFPDLWRSAVLRDHRRALRREGCDRCWQSCYVEPALRTDPRVALREPLGLLSELRRYVWGAP